MTQWFPKKKGLANGYTTMGHNLGSALYVPLIAALIGSMGMAKGMTVTGVAAIIIGILAYFVIRNTPQELGVYPDNVSKEVYETEYADLEEGASSRWTVAKLLKTKEMWLVAFIVGINQLVTTGVMSQMVPRNMEFGFSQTQAVSLMTVCALVGLVGSFGFGFIDQKLGVKTAHPRLSGMVRCGSADQRYHEQRCRRLHLRRHGRYRHRRGCQLHDFPAGICVRQTQL